MRKKNGSCDTVQFEIGKDIYSSLFIIRVQFKIKIENLMKTLLKAI